MSLRKLHSYVARAVSNATYGHASLLPLHLKTSTLFLSLLACWLVCLAVRPSVLCILYLDFLWSYNLLRYIQLSVGTSANKIWSIFETKGLHNISSSCWQILCYACELCCVHVCKLICLPSRFCNDTLGAHMDVSTVTVR